MPTVKIHEQQKEWAIKAAAGVATVIFFYVAMIQPVVRDIVTARQGIMTSQERQKLYLEVQSLTESIDSNEGALAPLTERSRLLGKISDAAGKAQLQVEKLIPRTEPEGGYIKLRMEMDGKGTFFSLLKFLQAVEKIGVAVKVRDVSMLWKSSAVSPKNKYPLQLRIVFETLLKQKV